MSAPGPHPPSEEAKVSSEEAVQETVITVQETAKAATKTDTAPFSNYWRILSHRTTADTFALLVGFLCAVGAGTALPLMNIVFGHLVRDFNGYFLPNTAVTEDKFKSSVSKNALYIVYLFVGKFVLTYVSIFCFRTTGLRISANLRLSYLDALFAQPVQKIDEVSSGTVANTITTSANTIQMSISDKLHALFMALALTVTAYAIAFRYSWALTLVISSTLLFILVVFCISTPIVVKQLQGVEEANAKAASIAGEIFSSIRTVFSLNAEKTLTSKYVSGVDEAQKRGVAMSLQLGIQLGPMFFAMYSSFALAFWYGLKLFREGHISNISTVITVVFSVLIVIAVLGAMAAPGLAITKAVSVSPQFFSMIDSRPAVHDGLAESEVSASDDIELEDVSFAYPNRPTVQVLNGLNARFEKGKTTALVGPSGSGKSTIVALLERWYELKQDDVVKAETSNTKPPADKGDDCPRSSTSNHGIVSIGGRDVTQVNLKWWRSRIGLVQQEPFIFNDTIFNNVAFGLTGTEWQHATESGKRERIERACKEAFADEFIQQLPDGYLTKVGESGVKLSGGQRQRLAIARSIIREPAILILDEATSSIDVRGERIVQKALDRVSRNRTTIVIAHRLSTIRRADKIIVMREGRNVEEGTHGHLLSRPDGLYASLVHAQQLEAEPAPEKPQAEEVAIPEIVERKETHSSSKEQPADAPTSTYRPQGFFFSFGRLLYEQRRHWIFYLLILVGAMGAGSGFSLQSWIFARLVEVFRLSGEKLKERGDFWSLMFFVLALGLGACYFSLGFTSNRIAVYVSSDYRRKYFQDILCNPISFFDLEANASGSLMSRLSTDPKLIQELLGFNGIFPLISMFQVTGCVAISFTFGWKLALVTFFSAMPVIFIAAFVRIGFEVKFEEWNATVFAHSSQFATEAVGAFRTVTSLTMEDSIIKKYSSLLRDQVRKATIKATYAALVFALSDSLELCAMALTFWYGGQLLASHEYNTVQFFVIYVAIVQGAQAAGQFFSFAPNIAQATAAANRILSLRHEVRERQNTNPTATTTTTTRSEMLLRTARTNVGGARIRFKDVAFQYPTRDTPIFRNLNLAIAGGQFVAFVGPSGCGKTTVISLLDRFYEAQSGTITFNDQNIRDLEMASYRRSLALVAQEPKLFDGTIRENLLLGLEGTAPAAEGEQQRLPVVSDETETERENLLIQACRDAEIHDFIISLPDGYDTALGINNGSSSSSLSGGQKQRLCLARALLRRPTLLLLDEATSSLDSQSEKLVQSAIERLVSQRSMTVVAVAHRLATVQKADVIFVFGETGTDIDTESGTGTERGGHGGSRILEHGTHHELLRRRGTYWQMCQEQALDR